MKAASTAASGFELIVLGAGSALPHPVTNGLRYGPSGYVLRDRPGERVTLLDCGPGSIRSLGDHGIAVEHVERGRATLAYSGDTGEVPEQVELARDADLYLVECASNDSDPAPHHLHPQAVARLAEAAQPRRLLLTHFYPGVDPEASRAAVEAGTGIPTLAAHDGWRGWVESA